jgi:hypothetical protein
MKLGRGIDFNRSENCNFLSSLDVLASWGFGQGDVA